MSRSFLEGAIDGPPHSPYTPSHQALDRAIAISSQMRFVDRSATIMLEAACRLRNIRFFFLHNQWLDTMEDRAGDGSSGVAVNIKQLEMQQAAFGTDGVPSPTAAAAGSVSLLGRGPGLRRQQGTRSIRSMSTEEPSALSGGGSSGRGSWKRSGRRKSTSRHSLLVQLQIQQQLQYYIFEDDDELNDSDDEMEKGSQQQQEQQQYSRAVGWGGRRDFSSVELEAPGGNHAPWQLACRSTVEGAVAGFLRFQNKHFPKLQALLGVGIGQPQLDTSTSGTSGGGRGGEEGATAVSDPGRRRVSFHSSTGPGRRRSLVTEVFESEASRNDASSSAADVVIAGSSHHDWINQQWHAVESIISEVRLVQQAVAYRKVLLSLTSAIELTPDVVKIFMGDLQPPTALWGQQHGDHYYDEAVLSGTVDVQGKGSRQQLAPQAAAGTGSALRPRPKAAAVIQAALDSLDDSGSDASDTDEEGNGGDAGSFSLAAGMQYGRRRSSSASFVSRRSRSRASSIYSSSGDGAGWQQCESSKQHE